MNRLKASNLAAGGMAHGFFGREGGVSTGLYESLNCGPGSSDDPKSVAENRQLVVTALAPGLQDARLISLSQIHSAIVHTLPAWGQHQGAAKDQRPEGDAMVTATPGLALGILTADCAPVLLADAKVKVIGAAHAGWKGALAGVLEATLEAMEKLGASRNRIRAAIGPCISQNNYEVGDDFRERFLEKSAKHRRFFVPSDKANHHRFDLPGFAAHRLSAAGVGSVERLEICTYPPENGYFSFRRTTHAQESDYGRQISAIVLTE
jgi:YfiH family protein